MVKRFVFSVFAFVLAAGLVSAAEKPKDGEQRLDRDNDGRKETLAVYKNGKRVRTAVDSNADGKEDQFSLFLQGRDLVLKEKDTNFDGKIDWRSLQQFNPNKKMTVMQGNRAQQLPLPGYDALWKQIDNNFDGKIDIFHVKGRKDAELKTGGPIKLKPTLEVSDAAQKP